MEQNTNKDSELITEYTEQEGDLVEVSDIAKEQEKNENLYEEIKKYGEGGASVKVTVSEAIPTTEYAPEKNFHI